MSAPLCMLLLAMLSLTAADILEEEDLKTFVLDYHNELRRNEGASDMTELTWSDELATESLAWANKCVFEHQMAGRGENLAFDSNKAESKDVLQGEMQRWFDEKNDFSWGAASCGYSCHYTQLVWANTTKVGCAAITCPSLYAFGRAVPDSQYLVCFYDPKGNMGTTLYTRGEACSKCPAGYTCNNKLCQGSGSATGSEPGSAPGSAEGTCVDKNENCKMWADVGECDANPGWMKPNCPKSCSQC